jgi:hypothetical protein
MFEHAMNAFIVLFAAVIAWHMVEVARAGRLFAQTRDQYHLGGHKSRIICMACCFVIMVALIEMQVLRSPAPRDVSTALLAFHLAVIALLVSAFLAIVLRYTGLYRPMLHRRLAYSFFGLYGLAGVSGFTLLYQLPY